MIRRQEAHLWTPSEVYKLVQLFQDQQADTSAFLDSLPFAVATVAGDGKLTSANGRFAEMFGLRTDVLTDHLLQIVPSEALGEAIRALEKRTLEGSTRLTVPHPKAAPDYLKVSITPRGGRAQEAIVTFEVVEEAIPVRVFTPPVEMVVEEPVVEAPAIEPVEPVVEEPVPVVEVPVVEEPVIAVPVVEVQFPVGVPYLVVDGDARIVGGEGLEAAGFGEVVGSGLTQWVDEADRLRFLERFAGYFQGQALAGERIGFRLASGDTAAFEVLPFLTVTDGQATDLRLVMQREAEVPEPVVLEPEVPLELLQGRVHDTVQRMAAGIGQEFSGQLKVIHRHADILLQRYSLVEGLREELELIRRAAASAADLSQRLLHAGLRDDAKLDGTSINSVMGQAEAMLRALAGMGISCTFRLAPGLGPVRLNVASFERALVNLIIFARDSMPDGGTIAIDGAHLQAEDLPTPGRADLAGRTRVGIAVSYSGTPLTAEDLANIFEPFYLGSTGRNFGLMLVEARGIIEQAGGELMVLSAAEGTQFVILLPKLVVEAPVTTPVSPVQERRLARKVPELSGPKVVLLVDDDQDVRRVIRSFLERGGFEVIDASDGREAISAGLRYPGTIDVLLTDVQMQHMDGYELARTITETRPETKVLFMTGYQDEQDLDNPVLAGRFVQKPFTEKSLIGKLKSMTAGEDRLGETTQTGLRARVEVGE